ncbi:hypothetical protein [Mesorhizobium sp. M7A.F.Ca.US.002.01.1.1]|uniref:hypothetical protein n=1 Tax=Mesorhizobium sp. M7A.F.Ca.US.002.01.1.1 TaxID=2496700 RepID=UPI0032AF659D
MITMPPRAKFSTLACSAISLSSILTNLAENVGRLDHLVSAPAALTTNDHEFAADRANRDGLDKAALADRFRQFAKLQRSKCLRGWSGWDELAEGDTLLHGLAFVVGTLLVVLITGLKDLVT